LNPLIGGEQRDIPTIWPTQYITKTIALAILFFVLPTTFLANKPNNTMKPCEHPANNHNPARRPYLVCILRLLINTVPIIGGFMSTETTNMPRRKETVGRPATEGQVVVSIRIEAHAMMLNVLS
jgi:hypothetical protein